MEFFGPALELVKTGSPFVSGFTGAWIVAGFLMREMRRHYAIEASLRQERYDELKTRHDLLREKCDVVTEKWLKSEQEKAALIRAPRTPSRRVGDS